MKRRLPPSSDPDVRRKVKADVAGYRERLAAALAVRRPRPVKVRFNRARLKPCAASTEGCTP